MKNRLVGQVKALTYQVRLQAGKLYVIDLISPDQKALDPYLYLTDQESSVLAEDHDSGGGLNARILYRASAEGVYHMRATSLNHGAGEFTLTVRLKE